MNKVLTQFKREFWESRASFMRTPLYLGAILMALLLLGTVTAQQNFGQTVQQMREGKNEIDIDVTDTEFLQQLTSGELYSAHPQIMNMGLAAIYTVFAVVLLLVLQSYLLSALYTDRRDQSILFWKSLPVTESQNVLTKLGAAVLGAPLFYGAAALVTGIFYLLALTIFAGVFLDLPMPGFGHVLGAFIGSIASLLAGWLLLALWALPIFCWLLLCSALARKAPFLMALGIPLSLIVLEAWVLGSAHLGSAVKYQIHAALATFVKVLPHPDQIVFQLRHALTAPAFWAGLVISGVLLSGSIWLRNYRYEI